MRLFQIGHRGKRKFLKIIIVSLLVVLSTLVVAISIIALKKEAFLKWGINYVSEKLHQRYQITPTYKTLNIENGNEIVFKKLQLLHKNKKELFFAQDFKIEIAFLPLFFGNIDLTNFQLSNARISLSDVLLDQWEHPSTDNTISVFPNLTKKYKKWLNRLFDECPENLLIKNLSLTFIKNNHLYFANVQKVELFRSQLNCSLLMGKTQTNWRVLGSINLRERFLDLKWYAKNEPIKSSFLQEQFNIKCNFDTLNLQLQQTDNSRRYIAFDTKVRLTNLAFQYDKISEKNLVFPAIQLESIFSIAADNYCLDSLSKISIGKMILHPYLKYYPDDKKRIELGLHIPSTPAQTLLSSIPSGLFQTLEGLSVEGELGYKLHVALDEADIKNVILNSKVSQRRFKINSTSLLSKMNDDFIYVPCDKNGTPQRHILISELNPTFTPLEQISPNIINTILTAEDFSFYSHKGFNEEAMAKALATNFKAKAYKRGGSTISMQLIKNVFLNQKKNLLRKVEEIILVWLIENQKVTTKDRMLEVYFNIVEWGPNVYGIKEAAEYYFQTNPSDLTIPQSIFLASIVPSPKNALKRFDSEGNLKPNMKKYYSLIGNLMTKRGTIPPSEDNYGFNEIRLPIYLLPHSNTSNPLDTTTIDEDLLPIDIEE